MQSYKLQVVPKLLEPRFFRRADDPGVVMGYLGFLQAAVGLVEDLNLNRRIWTKQ